MGYRIVYDGQSGKYEAHKERKGFSKLIWIAAGILVFSMCACPQEMKILRSALIPGDDVVTVQAFQNMTDDLRSGASVGEAVEAFCRFVIHGE